VTNQFVSRENDPSCRSGFLEPVFIWRSLIESLVVGNDRKARGAKCPNDRVPTEAAIDK